MTNEHRGGCLNCPRTEDLLPLDEVLYYGFGGYSVQVDGEVIYRGKPNDSWEDFKTLAYFEELAEGMKGKFEVILDNPLRGAKWERKEKGKWVLTETNQGFA